MIPLRAIALAGVLAFGLAAADPQALALQRVEAFIAAHNRHDIDAAMAIYADDAVFQLNGGRPAVQGQAAIRALEAFDVVAGSNVANRGVHTRMEGADVVVSLGEVVEHSRVFAAMGLETVTTQAVDRAFVIRPDGRIAYLAQPEFDPACRQMMVEGLTGVTRWLIDSADPRAAALTRDGRVTMTTETLPALIVAIGDWRRASGWSPDRDLAARCAAIG